ncbi:hypothetical protein PR048_014539 [Dryococelus australis]|uniref:Uncharacterized protein n=1 Tax=Dryococelus australis TaxID=614101 RepID=A0ABQ9HEX3_9NEOP|nr:hypothetical protein PR048_014539 [Dryococelus australis]
MKIRGRIIEHEVRESNMAAGNDVIQDGGVRPCLLHDADRSDRRRGQGKPLRRDARRRRVLVRCRHESTAQGANMARKLLKFVILFDNTNLLYFPGQFLSGRVLIELENDTPALEKEDLMVRCTFTPRRGIRTFSWFGRISKSSVPNPKRKNNHNSDNLHSFSSAGRDDIGCSRFCANVGETRGIRDSVCFIFKLVPQYGDTLRRAVVQIRMKQIPSQRVCVDPLHRKASLCCGASFSPPGHQVLEESGARKGTARSVTIPAFAWSELRSQRGWAAEVWGSDYSPTT